MVSASSYWLIFRAVILVLDQLYIYDDYTLFGVFVILGIEIQEECSFKQKYVGWVGGFRINIE